MTERCDEIIAGHRVVRLLGRGGMAEVYEVEHVQLGLRRAMKVFTAERRILEESALSEQSREAWRLLSGAGLSVKDVARQLGIPANTVSKIKRRMESRLAAMFGMYE